MWLEDGATQGVLPIYEAAFLIDIGKNNRERSPSAKQLLELIWLVLLGALPIHYISTSLSIFNDGEYSPSIMFPSFPSICNDGKHSLSFLSSFPFEASAMIESTPIQKPPFPSTNSLKDRKNCYPMVQSQLEIPLLIKTVLTTTYYELNLGRSSNAMNVLLQDHFLQGLDIDMS